MAYFYSPFRKVYSKDKSSGCPFCNHEAMAAQTIGTPEGTLFENNYYRWVINTYPKFEGHTMLVPHEHLLNLEDESPESVLARHELLQQAVAVLKAKYPDCGIEYFVQTGAGSESSVPHLHWHLLPAQPDDNLRSFEKLGHFYTTEPNKEKVVLFPQPITMSPDELRTFLSEDTE